MNADAGERARGTGIHAFKAQGTGMAIDKKGVFPGQGIFRAQVDAGIASHAGFGFKADLYSHALALRVMTPQAGERAALEKYHRADARAVIQGISLDFKCQRPFHAMLLYRAKKNRFNVLSVSSMIITDQMKFKKEKTG
jgi:hypothetical protein